MQKEDKVCNITPANRVGSVQEYYFSKKLKEVAEMNAAGKNVINLGVGRNSAAISPPRPVDRPAMVVMRRGRSIVNTPALVRS